MAWRRPLTRPPDIRSLRDGSLPLARGAGGAVARRAGSTTRPRNLIEEVDELSRQASALDREPRRTIMEHLSKLASPAERPRRGWLVAVDEAADAAGEAAYARPCGAISRRSRSAIYTGCPARGATSARERSPAAGPASRRPAPTRLESPRRRWCPDNRMVCTVCARRRMTMAACTSDQRRFRRLARRSGWRRCGTRRFGDLDLDNLIEEVET